MLQIEDMYVILLRVYGHIRNERHVKFLKSYTSKDWRTLDLANRERKT